jgi:hypothetical protein
MSPALPQASGFRGRSESRSVYIAVLDVGKLSAACEQDFVSIGESWKIFRDLIINTTEVLKCEVHYATHSEQSSQMIVADLSDGKDH